MFIRHIIRVPHLYRGLATHAGPALSTPATLHLKTGQSFYGKSFGAPKSIFGETVFSTSITSYTESMTDPSYRGQILVFTTPMIGNYGVPHNTAPYDSQDVGVVLESQNIQCAGVIVGDVAEKFSHYMAVESLASWCKRNDVPGITGVDTRAITRLLRDQGTTLGRIAVGSDASLPIPEASEFWDPTKENLVDQVSTKVPYQLNPNGSIKVAVLDFGAKANILRSLVRRDAAVTVFPWNYDFNAVRDQYDGLFLTNGPGDPAHCMEAALNLRRTLEEWNKPVFGICMGHQVIGMAAGLDAYRMTFGNRGHNQPVLALASSGSIKAGRVYVTSQNHQYALKLQDPFPQGWEPFFINCNDSSVEGIKSTDDSGKKVWGVQFHPESAGGPLDTIEVSPVGYSYFYLVAHQCFFRRCSLTSLSPAGHIRLNLILRLLNIKRLSRRWKFPQSDKLLLLPLEFCPLTTTTMNFLDTYDVARPTTPNPTQEQQPSLNEEVNQVIGQFSRFWGGFKKQSQTAIETARKDFSEVVVQAQKELSKYTAVDDGQGGSTTTSNSDSASQTKDDAQTSASVSEPSKSTTSAEEQASTSTENGANTPRGHTSTGSQSLFSRFQAALPPNIVATVQNNIPESLKHASENIDLNQIRTNLLTEFQRVQGVTRAQAEEYVHKSEVLLRDAVKEAGEVLRDAVKIVPPDQGGGIPVSGSGLMWDGTDMWMLPYETNESTSTTNSKEKDGTRGIPESQSAVASRAEALVRRLKCDPSILRHDPEAEDGAKEQYAKWRETEVETKDGGVDGAEWKSKIAEALEEHDGDSLKQTMAALVPSEMTESTFWLRYFFRAHQIYVEREKRKALLQSTTDQDDDFSWEDDEDETSPASTQPPTNPILEIPQIRKSKDDSRSPSEVSQPETGITPSPRLSRDGSFDVISSNVSLAGDEKTTGATTSKPNLTKDDDDDDSGDSDWE
ncbi:hypothetical protein CVT24_007304 [Panaeolus cyanescens]|uniref:carbamoyl-phosphate synthase (glutamine-hydrolyzing) n=1 Tax=Panaeolus cyanescens TaxID=181874 RepID=A0A409VJB1_9AGAR|nr:hypothetical protein CVT24_007304 [Panaeolus cyanescens]